MKRSDLGTVQMTYDITNKGASGKKNTHLGMKFV